MTRANKTTVYAASLSLLLLAAATAAQDVFKDVSPNFTDTHALDPDRATGGRVNGLAIVPTDGNVMYAASEWGGIYKSTNAGIDWARLFGHLPTATWDVEVDPSAPQRIYATSFYDGRAVPVSGINVSNDAGVTWSKPATSVPPAGFCLNAANQVEMSAFGIEVDAATPATAYVGTSCGLAKTTNSGSTWTFIDPTAPAGSATRIWDVRVLGSVVHVCGDDGYLRSDDGGGTWPVAGSGLPAGRCSLAVSPDESYVLLAVVGTSIYESDDNGATWTFTRSNLSPQGRIPFVETNQRADNGPDNVFDLWFGDVSLYRVECTTPSAPAPGGTPRCGTANVPPWLGPFTRAVGAHDDTGGLLFDPSVAVDACPILLSSDGGVYYNTDATPDCHNPDWAEPSTTPHGLWPFSMSGTDRAGADEDLYFGNQDNGLFGTIDISASDPTWHNELCCDGFDTAGDDTGAMFTICCFGGAGRSTRLLRTMPGFVNAAEINTYPAGGLQPSFDFPDAIVNWGGSNYVSVTRDCSVGVGGCTGADGGVFITTDITAAPIIWTELGNATEPPTANICGVYASVNGGGTPTFYAQSGSCNSLSTGDRLFRFTGTNPAGTWTELTLPSGGFGVVGVRPGQPNRLIASGLTAGSAAMFSSTNGGTTWSAMPALDSLMDGGGDFPMKNTLGPGFFTNLTGYWQPSMLAFDPSSPRVVAGGQDSGVFLSDDLGTNWRLITDPNTSDVSGIPHIARPRYGYFDTEAGGAPRLYIGSQGTGIWRITLLSIFSDNFETGDTSAWSSTIP